MPLARNTAATSTMCCCPFQANCVHGVYVGVAGGLRMHFHQWKTTRVRNVFEWVEDCWNRNYVGAPSDGSAWTTGDCTRRVLRGGSCQFTPEHLRSAAAVGWRLQLT